MCSMMLQPTSSQMSTRKAKCVLVFMGASPTRLARAPRYLYPMLLRRVAFPDFCEPCLPSPAAKPPAGAGWLHEIKHDGFRMLVRRDAAGVRLFTRNGHDWTGRFPLIARAALSLKAASCLIDGEAVACDNDGLPVFEKLRSRRADAHVFLSAFDLLELDGRDLRRRADRAAQGVANPIARQGDRRAAS
jgi:ATP-dependent DNA ligase